MESRQKKILAIVLGTGILAGLFWVAFYLDQNSSFRIRDSIRNSWFLCGSTPRVTLVDPSPEIPGQCRGTAKIQGIQYKCSKRAEVQANVSRFYKNLVSEAREMCQDFCQDRHKNCRGLFRPPSSCGFQVPSNYALKVGKRAGCHEKCEGTAFAYCSLYHGYYLQVDESVLKDKIPNCHCVRG